MRLTLIYWLLRLRWAAWLGVGDTVRWTVLRLCDFGMAVRTRCEAAEVDVRIAHLESLVARAGLKGLVRPSEMAQRAAAEESCADDIGVMPANVHPIRPSTTEGSHPCRKPL